MQLNNISMFCRCEMRKSRQGILVIVYNIQNEIDTICLSNCILLIMYKPEFRTDCSYLHSIAKKTTNHQVGYFIIQY